MKATLLFLLLSLSSLQLAHATHNYAGEIRYVQISELLVQATVTTYTKASSTEADRDSLTTQQTALDRYQIYDLFGLALENGHLRGSQSIDVATNWPLLPLGR